MTTPAAPKQAHAHSELISTTSADATLWATSAQATVPPPDGYRWSLASQEVIIQDDVTEAEQHALNPAGAEADGLSASVRVGCLNQGDGSLSNCTVITLQMRRSFRPVLPETPDPGFAAAALFMAQRTRIFQVADFPSPAPGDLVVLSSEWPFRYQPLPPGYVGVSPTQFARFVRPVPEDSPLAPDELASLPRVRWSDFSRSPDQSTMQRVLPLQALSIGASVQVLMLCRVTDGGALSACDAIEEQPANLGFGAAAVSLAPQIQVNPERSSAALREHQGYVLLVLRWRGQ